MANQIGLSCSLLFNFRVHILLFNIRSNVASLWLLESFQFHSNYPICFLILCTCTLPQHYKYCSVVTNKKFF